MLNYIIATDKPWHVDYFISNRHKLSGNWSLATCPADLEEQASKLLPRFIFFPHWSEIVPAKIFEKYDCVCFHMTDVPFGRGGSPLQNLIVRGHTKTVVSALKMNEGIDSGPVYLKRALDLTGSALDIFQRTAPVCFDMMHKIQMEEITPVEQAGEPTIYKRRTPAESRIPEALTIEKLYDFVRMLDAPNYPRAFFSYGDFRIEMFNARVNNDETLSAEVKVTKHEE